MHKYVADEQRNGVFVLVKDGNNACCPKTLALIPTGQDHQGRMTMGTHQNACSTACPFAEIKKKPLASADPGSQEYDNFYEISCEGRIKQIVLDEIKIIKKPGGLLSVE